MIPNNNLLLRTTYDWDVSTSSWLEELKYEYTYDANNNLLLKLAITRILILVLGLKHINMNIIMMQTTIRH